MMNALEKDMWRFDMTLGEAMKNQELAGMWEREMNFRERVIEDLKDNRIIVDKETGLKITTKKDPFTIEEAILDCWNIIEDLQLIIDNSADIEMDKITKKYLESIKVIYSLKFEKLWKAFEND